MHKKIRISIDLMGGDNAPHEVIKGLNLACSNNSDVDFILYGREQEVRNLLGEASFLEGRYKFIHCDNVVSDNEPPIKALKSGKNSSMYNAIKAVKDREADVCISSGNTGTLMIMAKMVLGMLPNIKRPAIVSIYPNLKHGSVILDLGANADSDANVLLQFAVMGYCYAKIMLKKLNPTIGILNVGVEEYKGREVDKKTFNLLKESELNFYGFIEGHDLAQGTVDVVVTDGFTGNIVLKTSEGVGKICREYIKAAFNSSFIAKIGGLFAKKALEKIFKKIDPRNYNGAMFIGVDGIVIKSHGSSDAMAFNNAVENAINLARQDINTDISAIIEHYYINQSENSLMSKIKTKFGF